MRSEVAVLASSRLRYVREPSLALLYHDLTPRDAMGKGRSRFLPGGGPTSPLFSLPELILPGSR